MSRLLVAPSARRRGLAHKLLDRVVGEARARRLRAVLDVVMRDVAAIALYDAYGWRRLGGHTMTTRSGLTLEILV